MDQARETIEQLVAERNALAVARDQLGQERDALVQERNELGELRYRFEHERDVARAQIDRLRISIDQIEVERDAACRQLDASVAERDRLTAVRDGLEQERNELGELRYRFEHERDVARAEVDALRAALERARMHAFVIDDLSPRRAPTVPAPVTIFLHVAKTGGVTLGNVLNRQFEKSRILTADVGATDSALGIWRAAPFEQRYRELSPEQRRAITFVAGHFMFGVHRLFDQPSKYVTLLRHPVDRVVSSYYYILERPEIPVHAAIVGNRMSLDDYVDSGIGLDPHNYQTRILAGMPEYDATWREAGSRTEVPASALDAAKKNLAEHFLLAGITERFDEFLLILKIIYGWPLQRLLYTRENETRVRPAVRELSATTVARIERANRLDLDLYEFTRHRFEAEAKRWVDQLAYLRPRMQNLNQLHAIHAASPHCREIAKALELICAVADAEMPTSE